MAGKISGIPAMTEAEFDAPQQQLADAGPPRLPSDPSALGTAHGLSGDGDLPPGVTLTKIDPHETSQIENRLYSADELKGVTLSKIDAPHNSVFDADKNRVLSLPQTLSNDETQFVVKRDIDQIKNFYGMQDVGGFEALGKGIASLPMQQIPQAGATLIKEQIELSDGPYYGLRADGTKKGIGFLGELKRPDGNISTEISIGVDLGGKETEIPTLVPGLSKEQKDYLLGGGDPGVRHDIVELAVEHARGRISAGKSPFFDYTENQRKPGFAQGSMPIGTSGMALSILSTEYQFIRDRAVALLGGSKELAPKMDALIDRNKKYMAETGIDGAQAEGFSKVIYDIGSGASSLLAAMGLSAATGTPATAGAFFGALQKTQTYQEARTAGKTPEEASSISNVDGLVNAGMEYLGTDRLLKALHGNSAVQKFVTGFATEFLQEGGQQAANEAITQTTGVRSQPMAETVKNILYNAAIGGIVGGPSEVAIGHFVHNSATEQGLPDAVAQQMADYAQKNISSATQNMGEFIDKELAPIAQDSEKAREFITLMQKFGNDQDLVNPDELSAGERATFDHFTDMFNNSKFDNIGVAAVADTVRKQAVDAGIAPDQAEGAAQLLAARADAASRALGISPEEWLKSKGIDFNVEGAVPEDVKPFMAEAQAIKTDLENPQHFSKLDRNDPRSVARALNLDPSRPPKSVLQFIRSKGGISLGLTHQEFETLKATNKDRGLSTSKASMASGELQRIFDRNPRLGHYVNQKGLGLDEIERSLKEAGYLPNDLEGNEKSDLNAVMDLIEREANGERVYSQDVEAQLETMQDTHSGNLEYLHQIGIDENSSVEDIARALAERDQVYVPPLETDTTDVPFQKNEKVRGSADFSVPNKVTINLFKDANPSTLLHELGHLFLRDMRDVAAATNRPRVKADYETIKKWLGAQGNTLTVAQEEKFARGFEQYLREGVAPKPELQSAFDRFKQWLTSIYKSAKDLNVQLSPAVREVFDRMLGGDFSMAEKLNQEAQARNTEADYEAVANQEPESRFLNDTAALFRHAGEMAADAFVPVSTRLGKIDQGIKHAVRQYVFKTGLYTHEDNKILKPFIEGVSEGMTPQDYRVMDLALKNRDMAKVDFLLDKYGLQEKFAPVRDIMDNLYNEAKDVGLDMGYIEDYFPRQVKRDMVGDYMAWIRGQKQWSAIELAMKQADPSGSFTNEQQAEFVNSFLRGYQKDTIGLNKSNHTKERSVSYITPEANKFYDDSMQTLIRYVSGVRQGIESRKLFGKSEKETEDNIGAYVLSLINEGTIKPQQEKELTGLLRAVVQPTGTNGVVSWARDAFYLYTMGNPISSISQIQDLALSLHYNGYYRTGKSLLKSLTGNNILNKEDLGIENIMQEFSDKTRSSNAVKHVFDAVGLTFLDNVGKKTYIDGAYDRLVAANKKGGADWKEQLETVFGDEAGSVEKDLKDGTMSENVKYLLFSELSDVQPISLAEMPRYYLSSGNGRIFYMLKSYTIKQIDIYNRDIFTKIGSGDPKQIATGLKNLVGLAVSLGLLGMGTDEIKDLLLGRQTSLNDLVMNNLIKLTGVTKYQIYKSKEEGIATTFFKTLFLPPPVSMLDDLQNDLTSGKDVKDYRVLGHIPLVGNFYYWWWGGGAAQKNKGKSSVTRSASP